MNYVEDANELLQLIQIYEEVILFPHGDEGQVTLNFLFYTDYIEHICCVAAVDVDTLDNTRQIFQHFLPMVPFECLLHFRETGLIIVASPIQGQEELAQVFERTGFKNVVFLKPKTIQEINVLLQQIYSSGKIIAWFMSHVTQKITDMEYRITEQNEVCAVNTKAFADYRNRFRNKKIVLFATGPTSKYYTPIPDAIHIGVNFAWRRENIPLDYLFVIDGKIVINGKVEEGFNKIREKVFVGIYPPRWDWFTFSENFSLQENVRRFYTNGSTKYQRIYQNICFHGLADFCSVIFCALHFALFTYPKEIYLVGCDTSPTGHFYDPQKQNDMSIQSMKVGYARMKMFAKRFYPDTEIISVNPVGLKGLFRDVYTEEYLASLNKGE